MATFWGLPLDLPPKSGSWWEEGLLSYRYSIADGNSVQ